MNIKSFALNFRRLLLKPFLAGPIYFPYIKKLNHILETLDGANT